MVLRGAQKLKNTLPIGNKYFLKIEEIIPLPRVSKDVANEFVLEKFNCAVWQKIPNPHTEGFSV